VGCRRAAPVAELVRVVRTEDGGLAVGRSLPGRGAWLCAGSASCVEKAAPRLSRALRGDVRAGAVERLRAMLPEGDSPGVSRHVTPATGVCEDG
jgi:predicted RNA-binding protein YlxR (DUF448 family)